MCNWSKVIGPKMVPSSFFIKYQVGADSIIYGFSFFSVGSGVFRRRHGKNLANLELALVIDLVGVL